jgi:hypothetical protein
MNARANRRYALQVPVELQSRDDKCAADGLLIELSLGAARISQLGDAEYLHGEQLTLATRCGRTIPGRVRYSHGGIVGLQFDKALHLPELAQWVSDYRKELAAA